MHRTTRELRPAAALAEAAGTLTEGFDTAEWPRPGQVAQGPVPVRYADTTTFAV